MNKNTNAPLGCTFSVKNISLFSKIVLEPFVQWEDSMLIILHGTSMVIKNLYFLEYVQHFHLTEE